MTPDHTIPRTDHDYRNLAVEELALSEAALLERVESLERDVAAYRLVAQETLHALHHVTREHDRLRARLVSVTENLRALRRAEQEGRAA